MRTIGPAPESTLQTPETGHQLTNPVACAMTFYLFAAHLALHKGLNPDQPPLLSKATSRSATGSGVEIGAAMKRGFQSGKNLAL